MKKYILLLCSLALVVAIVPAVSNAGEDADAEQAVIQQYNLLLQQTQNAWDRVRILTSSVDTYKKISNNVAPHIRLVDPDDSAKPNRGSNLNVRWQGINLSGGTINIELFPKNNTSQITTLASSTANDGQEIVVIPSSIAAGQYYIQLRQTNTTLTSNKRLLVIGNGPNNLPAGFSIINQPNNTTIGGVASTSWATNGKVQAVHVTLTNGTNFSRTWTNLNNTGLFSIVVPNDAASSTNYKFIVQAANNPAISTTTSTFTISGSSVGARSISNVSNSALYALRGQTTETVKWNATTSSQFYVQLRKFGFPSTAANATNNNGLTKVTINGVTLNGILPGGPITGTSTSFIPSRNLPSGNQYLFRVYDAQSPTVYADGGFMILN